MLAFHRSLKTVCHGIANNHYITDSFYGFRLATSTIGKHTNLVKTELGVESKKDIRKGKILPSASTWQRNRSSSSKSGVSFTDNAFRERRYRSWGQELLNSRAARYHAPQRTPRSQERCPCVVRWRAGYVQLILHLSDKHHRLLV